MRLGLFALGGVGGAGNAISHPVVPESPEKRKTEFPSPAADLDETPHRIPRSKKQRRRQARSKLLILNGRRGGNRTHNPRLRRPVLYPIELLAHALAVSEMTVRHSPDSSLSGLPRAKSLMHALTDQYFRNRPYSL